MVFERCRRPFGTFYRRCPIVAKTISDFRLLTSLTKHLLLWKSSLKESGLPAKSLSSLEYQQNAEKVNKTQLIKPSKLHHEFPIITMLIEKATHLHSSQLCPTDGSVSFWGPSQIQYQYLALVIGLWSKGCLSWWRMSPEQTACSVTRQLASFIQRALGGSSMAPHRTKVEASLPTVPQNLPDSRWN